MSSVRNSVETVNAAATAIVTAESRVQPSSVQKRRWGSWWSLYWCFGSYKNGKRIGHAVLVPESTVPRISASVADSSSQSTTIVLPFIAPPSSPASFLQSDPPSATLSPDRVRPLASLSVNSCSPGGAASAFAIGPYAHETQLVSPPVFSAFTTEPSTAAFTPPPEPVQFTTPSSPEVPFAELLSSSLARSRKKYEGNRRFPSSQYDYQPYQYPGSPGSRIISPGSTIPNSGTSSPFPDKHPVVEFQIGEDPKFLGYDHFARKWGSRIGSGSLTPNGWGSRLGSGTLTPNGGISRLGSGTITPAGVDPSCGDLYLPENQISEVASLANSDNESQNEENLVDHRLSFELASEDVPIHEGNVDVALIVTVLDPSGNIAEAFDEKSNSTSMKAENGCQYSIVETLKEANSLEGEEKLCLEKHRSSSLGSSKDFNFENLKQDSPEKSMIDCEWWTNDKVAERDLDSQKQWTFFPMLHHGVSL